MRKKAEKARSNAQLRKQERRAHQRVAVNLLGRFMLPSRREYPCQVVNMSPGGAALISPIVGEKGDTVIAYLDHVGRIEGQIVRYFDGGFAMSIVTTERRREKLASKLTWLANRHELNLPEDRRHQRLLPQNPFSKVVLEDGREYTCRIMDLSLSGAAVAIPVRPPIGTSVTIGNTRGRLVRHLEDGVAVEFAVVQTPESIRADLF